MTTAGRSVAIVGIGCRFPGGIADPAGFWRFVAGGGDAIGEIPADRIDLSRFFDPRPATPGRTMTRWGAFLDRIEDFDAEFFGISPREAERIDPQQRLLLETGWEALEDAGWKANELAGRRGGVFVGQWISDFESRLFTDPEDVDFYMTTGSGRYAASGRLSYVLGLLGPSLTVDCACSSSLAAVHLAVQSIRAGESEFALAGGVNVILQPHISIAYSQSRMMAPDGRCKFGDARGDGYVRSEGAGLVVLKDLERALADGDRIYAVVRGSAVNNDGRGSGSMGTPSRAGQEDLLRTAYRDAGCAPGTVGYVEAHGTGTRAGDPVELGALGAVLADGRDAAVPAWVGSIKTNFGHTEGAAGVAGLIKAALALHHGAIPPSLHCGELNPGIPWHEIPVRIPRETVPWPAGTAQRRAGVSAFGIAGTNAHVVLESAPTRPDEPSGNVGAPVSVLVLSARSEAALRALSGRYADRLEHSDVDLSAFCWNAATRRAGLSCRAAFATGSRQEMIEALRQHAGGGPATVEGVTPDGGLPRAVFVFPGQGGQWVGMGRDLLATSRVFREALERCDAAARPYLGVSLLEQLAMRPEDPGYRLDRIELIQPALVALSIGYAALLRSLGVVPAAAVGHSMGEVGAAFEAGALDLDQAMRIICRRSALMAATSGRGAMAMVDLSMDEAARFAARDPDRVAVAASNSPRSSVLSGDPDVVAAIVAELEAQGVFARLVKVDVASHSPQMDGPAAALTAELAGLSVGRATVPLHSTVLGRQVAGDELGADYWGRNMRQPVRFHESIQELIGAGPTCFIELGPHPVLTPAIEQSVQGAVHAASAVACGRRDDSVTQSVGGIAAALWASGAAVDWGAVLAPTGFVELPTYPWQRERHWVRQAGSAAGRTRSEAAAVPLSPEQVTWLHRFRWEPLPTPASRPAAGREIVLVGSNAAVRAAFENAGALVKASASAAEAPPGLGPEATVVLLADENGDCGHAVLGLVPRLLEGGTGRRLVVATSGAQAVDGFARPRVSAVQGVLWGIGRVIAEEHPDLWGGLVDLDPSATPEDQAGQLLNEVFRGDEENQVAWRDGLRFGLRFDALDLDPVDEGPEPWTVPGAWLITGGLGEVPLQLAEEMVARGVRRLVLMGRTGLPPREQWRAVPPDSRDGRRIATIRRLESAGAAVHLLVADLAYPASVEAALGGYEAAAWPPIAGVLHAAGVLETGLASRVDKASFDRVMGPKLHGALLLDRLLPSVERFVMISSISAAFGIHGMASYAGANAGLDALAQDRRARGLHGLSVQSGSWIDAGMQAGTTAEQNIRQLRDLGVEGFLPEVGCRAFSAVAGCGEPVVTVVPVDWETFARARRGRNLSLFVNRLRIGSGPAPESISERLAEASSSERRRLLEPLVRDAVSKVLKMAPGRVNPTKAFGAMGLSSLLAMELRNRLEAALARPLSATLVWNYPTVDGLVAHLSGDAPVPAAAGPELQASAPEIPVAAVSGLTDRDAARLLRQKR